MGSILFDIRFVKNSLGSFYELVILLLQLSRLLSLLCVHGVRVCVGVCVCVCVCVCVGATGNSLHVSRYSGYGNYSVVERSVLINVCVG
jgi:hypothetical protein